jgi:hypothetical protein
MLEEGKQTAIYGVDVVGVAIDPYHIHAAVGEAERKGKPDTSDADDSHREIRARYSIRRFCGVNHLGHWTIDPSRHHLEFSSPVS